MPITTELTWLDPDGVPFDLTGQPDLVVMPGVAGRHAPPSSYVEDRVPFQAGAQLRTMRVDPREVRIPLFVQSATDVALTQRLRELVTAFDPGRGDGILRQISPDGAVRDLTCRQIGDLGLAEELGQRTETDQMLLLVFRAWEPYWKGETESEVFTPGVVSSTFFPFFPLTLGADAAFADVTIDNPGDVDAWPIWTVIGAGSGPQFLNLTTGKTLYVSGAELNPGDELIVDTTPGARTVTLNGANAYSLLSVDSSLFPLTRGGNHLQIQLPGTSGGSQITLEFRPRYRAP